MPPADFPELVALGPEHRALLEERLGAVPDRTCDLDAANLAIWRDCESPAFATVHGNLCIRLAPHAEPAYFLQPLGDGDLAASVEACLAHTGRVSRATASAIARLPADRFEATPLRDQFDYVYDLRAVAELKGTAHDGKRNQIRKFARNHPEHEVRPLVAGDGPAALALFDRWASDRAEEGGPVAAASNVCQRRALHRAFDEFGALGLLGAGVHVRGRLEGFILASRAADTVSAHFLYADHRLAGIYQTLLQAACRGVFAGHRLLNLEEDLGLPGLRRMKLSYQPLRLIEKFEVRWKVA